MASLSAAVGRWACCRDWGIAGRTLEGPPSARIGGGARSFPDACRGRAAGPMVAFPRRDGERGRAGLVIDDGTRACLSRECLGGVRVRAGVLMGVVKAAVRTACSPGWRLWPGVVGCTFPSGRPSMFATHVACGRRVEQGSVYSALGVFRYYVPAANWDRRPLGMSQSIRRIRQRRLRATARQV